MRSQVDGDSQVMRYPSHPTRSNTGERVSEADEEWVTKKKVEITTTKNVEKQIKRQVVLEDGRVVEEELPTITNDTTQDKQTFETDHDEERKVDKSSGLDLLNSKFNSRSGMLVGDKLTSVKKVQDVKENMMKTEACQHMGDIKPKDLNRALRNKEDIRKYLKKDERSKAVALPRTVMTKRNHRVITDKEDIQERNWLNDGKMQNERIRTEEHIEYDSDDTKDSGSSGSVSSRHQLEPEVYKTRKDEEFVEYFKINKDKNGKEKLIKIGDGAHFVSESKELDLEENRSLYNTHRSPRLTYIPDKAKRCKKQITHTDSWLERHFGSSSSSLSNSSVDLSRGVGGVDGGVAGLRRSASICDIRPVTESGSNVYYATVRKTDALPVVRREKKDDHYQENRRSAHFTSSGQPVRPPRRKKKTDSDSSHYMSQGNLYYTPLADKQSSSKTYSYSHSNLYGSTTDQSKTNRNKKPEYLYGSLNRDKKEDFNSFRQETSTETNQSNHKFKSNRRRENIENEVTTSTGQYQQNNSHQRSRTATGANSRDGTGTPPSYGPMSSTKRFHHHSLNPRSYSPTPLKIGRTYKAHHQSAGNIYNNNSSSTQASDRRYVSTQQPVVSSLKADERRYNSTQSMDRRGRRSGGMDEQVGTAHPPRHYRSTDSLYQQHSLGTGRDGTTSSRSAHAAQLRDRTNTREIPIVVARDSSPEHSPTYSSFTSKSNAATTAHAYSRTGTTKPSAGRNERPVGTAVPIQTGKEAKLHKIVYSSDSPIGSPSTKYRTKIVLNGGGAK